MVLSDHKTIVETNRIGKNMYKTARGVKTDTEIHLGRSKAIFLTLSYRRNRANYFDGPIKRSPFFVAEFRLLRSKKKLRKYHVGWNIFKNSIWISYNSRVNFFNKVKAWNILHEIRKLWRGNNKTFLDHFLCSDKLGEKNNEKLSVQD